jgi:hypothetical protein
MTSISSTFKLLNFFLVKIHLHITWSKCDIVAQPDHPPLIKNWI